MKSFIYANTDNFSLRRYFLYIEFLFNYARHYMIPGWLSSEDAQIINSVLILQDSKGVLGDTLEIGVYQGRSASILLSRQKSGETLFLCDIFGTTIKNQNNQEEISSSYDKNWLNSVYSVLKDFKDVAVELVEIDSIELPKTLKDNRFRFIHVDGSHLYSHVKSDLDYAVDHIDQNYGLICVDDYRSQHTPDVARAVWEVVATGKVKPLIMGPAKIILTSKNSLFDALDLYSYLKMNTTGLKLLYKEFLDFVIVYSNRDNLYRHKLKTRLLMAIFSFVRKSSRFNPRGQ